MSKVKTRTKPSVLWHTGVENVGRAVAECAEKVLSVDTCVGIPAQAKVSLVCIFTEDTSYRAVHHEAAQLVQEIENRYGELAVECWYVIPETRYYPEPPEKFGWRAVIFVRDEYIAKKAATNE